jgi:hypothetical protein
MNGGYIKASHEPTKLAVSFILHMQGKPAICYCKTKKNAALVTSLLMLFFFSVTLS